MILYWYFLGTGTCNQHNNREGERRPRYGMRWACELHWFCQQPEADRHGHHQSSHQSFGIGTNLFWYCKNSEYRSYLLRLLRTKKLKNNDMTHTSQRYRLTCPCWRKIFNIIMGLRSVSGLTHFFVNRARGKNKAPIADKMQTACRHPLLKTC